QSIVRAGRLSLAVDWGIDHASTQIVNPEGHTPRRWQRVVNCRRATNRVRHDQRERRVGGRRLADFDKPAAQLVRPDIDRASLDAWLSLDVRGARQWLTLGIVPQVDASVDRGRTWQQVQIRRRADEERIAEQRARV